MTIVLGSVVDGERVLDSLETTGEKLDGGGHELVLDFSLVHRMDPSALRQMEKLAAMADEKAVKITLRGVNTGVYKVLKLVGLTTRFSFLA